MMRCYSVPTSWLVIIALVITFACVTAAFLLVPPRRWQESLTDLNRRQVHALLGIPDTDFSAKGWDGWDKPAVVGAWVLKVYYDGEEHVILVQKKFDWGLGYLTWERDYRKRL